MFWRLPGGLLENVADRVSNGGPEGDVSRVESSKVYANELAWLEVASIGKCSR